MPFNRNRFEFGLRSHDSAEDLRARGVTVHSVETSDGQTVSLPESPSAQRPGAEQWYAGCHPICEKCGYRHRPCVKVPALKQREIAGGGGER